MPSNPPPPPYGTLQSLATYMAENGSCIPKPPMMTYGSGNAPGLNYNMEQKAGFTAYGHFRLNTDKMEEIITRELHNINKGRVLNFI